MKKRFHLVGILLCFSTLSYTQSLNLTDDASNNIHTVSGWSESMGVGTTTPLKLLHLYEEATISGSNPTTLRLEYCDGGASSGGGGGGEETCTSVLWDIYNNGPLNFEANESGTVFSLSEQGNAYVHTGFLKIGQASGFSPGGVNKLLVTEGRIMVGQEGVSGQLYSNLERNDLKFNRAGRSYISQMGNGQLAFVTNADYSNLRMIIDEIGNVGIGTNTPTYKLDVNGDSRISNLDVCNKIRAQEILVEISTWCDYVFDNDYQLRSLSELNEFIIEHKHLPDVPSEAEVKENGINVSEMNAILLKKIEELTLYILEQDKRISDLESNN